jgi:HEAT repeat protein
MAVTMEDVRARLDPEEVDYPAAAALGPDALPHLEALASSADAMLASKATYLASLIRGERAARVLEIAAARGEPAVRVAAASGLRNLQEADATPLVDRLLDDGDVGVRKMAVRSAGTFTSPAMRERLQRVVTRDREPFMRDLAGTILNRP